MDMEAAKKLILNNNCRPGTKLEQMYHNVPYLGIFNNILNIQYSTRKTKNQKLVDSRVKGNEII